jgi:hypothetical protein
VGILDKVKQTSDAIKAGNAETDGLGNELHERAAMTAAALGTPTAPVDTKPRAKEPMQPWEHVKRAPIKGEKPISPKDIGDWTKSLGSYKDGCDSVPKTGVYQLHEGEKVVPAHENPDNHDKDTNAVEDAFMEHSPSEKQHFARSMHKLHGGALHRHLGIPEGEPIPMVKKQEAANSSNPHVAAMGRLAVAMHGWSHKK